MSFLIKQKIINSNLSVFLSFGIMLLFALFNLVQKADPAFATIDPDSYSITVSVSDREEMNILPSENNGISAVKSTITSTTNSPSGYRLFLSTVSTNNNVYMEGEEGAENEHRIIKPTQGTWDNPLEFTIDSERYGVWGFAVPGLSRFDTSYNLTTPDINAKYAAVPTSGAPQLIHEHVGAISNDATDVIFGMRLGVEIDPGVYSKEIIYHVVTDVTDDPDGEMNLSYYNTEITYKHKDPVPLVLSTSLDTDLPITDVEVRFNNDKYCSNVTVLQQRPLEVSCIIPNDLEEGTYQVILSVPIVGKSYSREFEVTNKEATLLRQYEARMKIDNVHNYKDITAFRRSYTLPEGFAITDAVTISDPDLSETPIYFYYVEDGDEKIIYYYSDAGKIYFHEDSFGVFSGFSQLADISGFADLDASRVKNFLYGFYGLSVQNVDVMAGWNTSSLENAGSMFMECRKLTDISGLANWDMSHVTNMNMIFEFDINLRDLTPLALWDTGRVESMEYAFYFLTNTQDGTGLETLAGLEDWNVSSLKSMKYIFSSDYYLTDISALANWNVRNVETMMSAFEAARILTDISALAGWKTDSLKNLENTFSSTSINSLLPLSEWKTGEVTTLHSTFSDIKACSLDGLERWDVRKVKDMYRTFSTIRSCDDIDIGALADWKTDALTTLEETFFDNNVVDTTPLLNWNTSSVTTMKGTFKWGNKLENLAGLAEWDTSNVTDMSYMFYLSPYVQTLAPLKKWNVEAVKNTEWMFHSLSSITNLDGLEDWKTYSLLTANNMFQLTTKVTDISALEDWATGTIQNFSHMFKEMVKLESLHGLEDWNVSAGRDFSYMFMQDSTLEGISELATWNVSNATNMSYLFSWCTGLRSFTGVEDWNVGKVQTFSWAFNNAPLVTSLEPFREWDVRAAQDMSIMFYNCSSVTSLEPLAGWQTNSLRLINSIFDNMPNVDGTVLNGWNVSRITNKSAAFSSALDPSLYPTWYP